MPQVLKTRRKKRREKKYIIKVGKKEERERVERGSCRARDSIYKIVLSSQRGSLEGKCEGKKHTSQSFVGKVHLHRRPEVLAKFGLKTRHILIYLHVKKSVHVS